MSHWCHTMVDVAKFWISWNQPVFLSSFSCLQVIQNSVPSTIVWCQIDIRILLFIQLRFHKKIHLGNNCIVYSIFQIQTIRYTTSEIVTTHCDSKSQYMFASNNVVKWFQKLLHIHFLWTSNALISFKVFVSFSIFPKHMLPNINPIVTKEKPNSPNTSITTSFSEWIL